jgi:hypothetical protein
MRTKREPLVRRSDTTKFDLRDDEALLLAANTAESLAQLTGGEFYHFNDAKHVKSGLIRVSSNIPNYYVLSFRPADPSPGLHALRVAMKDHRQLVTRFRREYWVEETK